MDRTKTYMILRPQFWRGQQHGGRHAPPHARHMRALCDTVSSGKSRILLADLLLPILPDPKIVEQSPKNIVLFVSATSVLCTGSVSDELVDALSSLGD